MSQTFTVSVPATSANFGPGFDSFGFALDWYNHFQFTPASVDEITSTCPDVPSSVSDNLVFQALGHLFKQAKLDRPKLKLHIDATIPLARGLGSSSTAIVAGIVAGNFLLGRPFSDMTLAQIATEIEGHPDNVVPALLGGVKLFDDQVNAGSVCLDFPWPKDWGVLVIIPPYPVKTEDARRVLPESPSRADAIFNLRKASLLTYALLKEDAEVFAESLTDKIHQPYRGQLIKEWPQVQDLAKKLGALGSIISGSGPTMAVFYTKNTEVKILDAFNSWAEDYPGFIVKALAVNLVGSMIQAV